MTHDDVIAAVLDGQTVVLVLDGKKLKSFSVEYDAETEDLSPYCEGWGRFHITLVAADGFAWDGDVDEAGLRKMLNNILGPQHSVLSVKYVH